MSLLNVRATVQFAQVDAALRALGRGIGDELTGQLGQFGPALLERMRAGVPVRRGPRQTEFRRGSPRPSGGLRSLLTTRLDTDEGGARLSAGLLTRAAQSDGFYGFILDAGRGLKRSRSRPRTRYRGLKHERLPGMSGTHDAYTVRYDRRISPILPTRYDIAFGRVREFAHDRAGPMLLAAYDRALLTSGWEHIA